jgi:D-cysteine desulfhydrase
LREGRSSPKEGEVTSPEPALFRRFPALRARVPRAPVLAGPTPVEPLGVGAGGLWVKRDERSCALYGGNKPRKLEFILGAAAERRARRLVTTGGLGTNHGLATTILGRAAGLETTLVLVHQPVTDAVIRSLLLHAAYGARLVYGGNVPGAALQVARVLAGSAARGERPYLVAAGGSSWRGTLGFVSAGLELAEQIHAGALPEPAEIYVAVGTGGTAAGLLAGLRLAGVASHVVGVLVTDILPPSAASLRRDARRTLARLRRLDPAVPEVSLAASDPELVGDQLGDGYGAVTEAARQAVARAREADLRLETTYTGKCLAALLAREAAGALPGPALFWNTYNGIDVEAAAPAPLDAARLPARFRRFLERSSPHVRD